MNKKIFENARFCPKGDIEANWNKAVGFVPLDKEIIIYKKDETHSAARFKVGDGKTVVQELPFSGTDIEAIEKLIDEKGELLIEYVDNAVAALATEEYVNNAIAAIDIPEVEVDQTYNAKSENAQSGIAVSEAIAPIVEVNDEQDDKMAILEGSVTVASFDITEANTTITLKNLVGMTKINWGDGTINSELSHTYEIIGKYECKIYDVTEIGECAFDVVETLNSIKISNNVVSIGDNAFDYCTKLTSVVIPDSVTSIGFGAFFNCRSLTNIMIPDGVTFIDQDTFSYCTSLTNVELPNSITSISQYSFQYCTSLTSIEIPASVTVIGSMAFDGCKKLTTVFFNSSIPPNYKFNNWFGYDDDALRHIIVPYDSITLYKVTRPDLADKISANSYLNSLLNTEVTVLGKEIINTTYTSIDLDGLYGGNISYNETINYIPQAVNIVFDGATYNNLVTTLSENLGYFIGNLSKLNEFLGTTYENTGEPFVILYNITPNSLLIVTDPTQSTTHTISVLAYSETPFRIDEKYLPDDLLRTADKEELDSKISEIETTIGDINTALEAILGV